eukprot:TRINITY_DN1686_c0_g1_i3.p1 TRINITY_DN1686_c0_g1~~TRINITY_DN1686_c0_g1_i3.p1  ORF type:complete len:317 (+),score=67.80 TRINITY_DN1686_c0_g1_i3:63-1013(+)
MALARFSRTGSKWQSVHDCCYKVLDMRVQLQDEIDTADDKKGLAIRCAEFLVKVADVDALIEPMVAKSNKEMIKERTRTPCANAQPFLQAMRALMDCMDLFLRQPTWMEKAFVSFEEYVSKTLESTLENPAACVGLFLGAAAGCVVQTGPVVTAVAAGADLAAAMSLGSTAMTVLSGCFGGFVALAVISACAVGGAAVGLTIGSKLTTTKEVTVKSKNEIEREEFMRMVKEFRSKGVGEEDITKMHDALLRLMRPVREQIAAEGHCPVCWQDAKRCSHENDEPCAECPVQRFGCKHVLCRECSQSPDVASCPVCVP